MGHVSRDSTAIEARERATNTKKEVQPTGKPGRPKKGSQPKQKMYSVLEQQGGQTAEEAVRNLHSQGTSFLLVKPFGAWVYAEACPCRAFPMVRFFDARSAVNSAT